MNINLSKLKVGDSVKFRRGTCRVVSEIEYRKYDFFTYSITVLHDDSEYGYINYQFYNSYQFNGLCSAHGNDPGDIVEIIPQETIEIEDLTDLRELNILMKKEEKMKPLGSITFEMIERAFKYILNRWFQPPTRYPKRYVNLNEFKIVQTYARLYNVPHVTPIIVDLALKDYSLHPEKYGSGSVV